MLNLKRFFRALKDSGDNERRVLLTVVYFCLAAAVLAYLGGIQRNLIVIFAVIMFCCLLLVLRNILWPVKFVIPITGLAVFDYLIFNNYGLRDTSILGFPIIIIAASLLNGWRGSVVFGGASLASVVFLGWAEANGLVTNALSASNSLVDYLAVCILIGLTTAMQWALIKRLNDALHHLHAENIERQRTELSLRVILDNLPYWAWLKDTESRFLLVNKPMAHSMGFENPDDLAGKSDFDLTKKSLAEAYRADDLAVMQSRVQRFIEETVVDNGQERWAETYKSPICDLQGNVIGTTGFVRDITERKQAEASLRQRDAIMDAVAFAAEKFLQTHDWRENIQSVLAFLGEKVNASHTYIAENHTAPDGTPITSLRYEWSAPGVKPDINDSIFQNVPLWEAGFETWPEVLSKGGAFYGNLHSFSPAEVKFIRERGIKAMLEVPIFVGATWWGIIGYDDDVNEREFSLAEIEALKVAASIISAAIQRQRADSALRESEQLYRSAIETAGAAPYYQDYELDTYTFMSAGIHRLTGYTPEEMTPQLWNAIVEDSSVRGEGQGLSEDEAARRVRSGEIEIWKCDYLIRTRDGQLRWIADSAVELRNPDGVSYGSIGILQDITERKWALDEVQRLNTDLEQRVHERTAQLEAANKELESFSYSVSHDLRAPLRSINSFSQILLNDFGVQLNEDGQNFLKKVVRSSQEMNELIESLLSLSRLSRGELRRTEVDLSKIAHTVIENLCQPEPHRPVTCLVAEEIKTHADERLIKIVLENLLNNAWKYTSKTAHPQIEFGRLETDGAKVYFVRDNGAGFDMKYADKLFGAFQRLHAASEFPGHGIGLATVQRIIHRHGGKVWAEAKPGQGATFYFTLP